MQLTVIVFLLLNDFTKASSYVPEVQTSEDGWYYDESYTDYYNLWYGEYYDNYLDIQVEAATGDYYHDRYD